MSLRNILGLGGGLPPTTLSAARKEWDATIRDSGGHCPCCDRWGKVNRYKVTENMAKTLLWMAANHGTEWVDMPNVAPRHALQTKSYSTMKHWGLIERHPMLVNDDGSLPDKKFSGLWRVTPTGISFAKGKSFIPKHVYIYDDQVVDVSTDSISIQDCFGEKFSYDEAMSATLGGDSDG